MTVVIIGSVLPRAASELLPPVGPHLQPEFVTQLACAFERAGFDAVQIGQSATSLDATVLGQVVLAATARLSVVVTLPPDLADPVTAARAVGSLAALYPGRVHARVPALSDALRQAELIHLLQRLWQSHLPIDHDGPHYQVRHHWSSVRADPPPPLHVHLIDGPHCDVPVAKNADICLLPAGSPTEVAARIAGLEQFAGERQLRFGISVRPIMGADDDAVEALRRQVIRRAPTWRYEHGFDPDRADHACLLAAATRARGTADPFLGTVESIAGRLREYLAVGVRVFHLDGFNPLTDVANLAAVADQLRGSLAESRAESQRISHDRNVA
jgi:alkanesulfonate monooxygenase